MKTDTKKLDKCQVKLTVTLDADEAKTCIKEVEKAFVREVRMPGFRPGKAPIELVRKNFAPQMKEETGRVMMRKHYSEAVKAENLAEVALADVTDVKCDAEGGSFTAIVDVKPVFKVPSYKGLKIAPANTKVEDSAVAEQVERLRAAYAKFEDAKEGEAVADGDFVQIDYSGTVDGKPILEVAPEAKIVASGTGFWTQIEEGRFLAEILEALKGMKAGETKDGVKATFDKESAPDPLKGKKAVCCRPTRNSPRRRRSRAWTSWRRPSANRWRSRPSSRRPRAVRTTPSRCCSRSAISTCRRARSAAPWTAISTSSRSVRSMRGSLPNISRRTATRF